MPKPSNVGRIAALLRALADHTRLRLLSLLATREMCVCYFVEALQTTQPKISRHLAYLRRTGIVSARRDHKWIHCQLRRPTDPGAARVLREVMATVAKDPQMLRDRLQLSIVCSAPQKFVHIQGAPLPTGAEPFEAISNEDQNDQNDRPQARFADVAH